MKLEVGQRFRCQCRKSVLLLPDLEVPWEKVDVFEAEKLWLWGAGKDPIKFPKVGPWEVVLPRPLEIADMFWLMADVDVPWVARLVVDGVTLDPLVYELVVIQVKDLDDPAAEARMRSEDGAREQEMRKFAASVYQAMEIPEGLRRPKAEKSEKAPEPAPKPGGRKVSWE